MSLKLNLPSASSNSIAEVFSEVWDSGTITEYERKELKSALLHGNLSSDDHAAIDRLVHAVKRGWLRLDN